MGKKWKRWHFIFLCSKITADSDWSHEIKRHLLFERKATTNLGSVLKSRDITLSTKVRIVKTMLFPAVMYRCKSGTIKKIGHWRIDAFELWCRRRLLRVPWTAKRSNQSILKEINPEYSLEGLMLKLNWCSILWPPDVKSQLVGKDPDAAKDWEQEEKGTTEEEMVGWHHPLRGHEFEQTPGDGDGQRSLVCCSAWGHGQIRLSNWTTASSWSWRVVFESSKLLRRNRH